jgi:hypothetical protein
MNKVFGILLVGLFVSAWLGSDNVWAGNWNSGTSGANSNNLARINQIMIGDARKGYKFNHRNVTSKKAFKMLEHQGILAARIRLSIDMGGADGDWRRRDISGYAQRFEYGEKVRNSQKFDEEIWTRLVFWLPKGTISKKQVTLFDLKRIIDGGEVSPVLNLALADEGRGTILKIKHNFEKNDCIIGLDGKTGNGFCDKVDVNVIFGPVENFTGKWVDFVSRAVWSNKTNGVYDAWIDGKKVIGYRGSNASADRISFKFGLYRIKLNRTKNPKDVTVYFSKVGTARSCRQLDIPDCKLLLQTQGKVGYPGAMRVFRHTSNEKSDFIAKGGKVLKKF